MKVVFALIASGAATAAFVAGAGAAPDAAAFRATPGARGLVVRLVGAPSPRVVFTSAGRTLATFAKPPYRITLPGFSVAQGRGSAALVARDGRGRPIATLPLSPRPGGGTSLGGYTTATPAGAVAPPAAPAPYDVPAGAVRVSTSAELSAALNASAPSDIVLADGTYDAPRAFLNGNGHRVYAAHLGKAVLKTGFVLGGNWGPGGGLLQGLAFDVSDPAKTTVGAIVDVWGKGQGSRVLDVTFDGNAAVGMAVFVQQPEGFVGRRLVARRFTSDGIAVDTYPTPTAIGTPPVLEDLDVSAVSRAVPRSSDGTAEACLWVGVRAQVHRVKVRNCAWMGIWTGSYVTDAVFSDLDVDATPVGVYLEHFTTSSTFRSFHIGSSVSTGFNCEWADPQWGGKPGSVDNAIQDGLIESSRAGVVMDEGTIRTAVRRVVFRNQSFAAISDYKGIGNSYADNDYSGIAAGAAQVTTRHL